MGFIENIKKFFSDMYDAIIGKVVLWISDFYDFLSSSWDLVLIVLILVLSFFVFRSLKYLTLPLIITGQIAMLTVSITFMLSFVTLITTSLVGIYNKIFSLANYINSSASGVSCMGHMFSCMGISGTFSYFFTELFTLFIVVLLFRLSGTFLWALNFISEKIYRIGVLIGLV